MRALAGLLLVAAFGHVAFAQEGEGFLIERDTVDIKPDAKIKVKQVKVDNRLGDVTVVGHDGPGVSLTVVKRAPDGEGIERLKVNLVTDPDGTISIDTVLLAGQEQTPMPAQSVRVDITLEVPRSAHVGVKAWNGKIEVGGLRKGVTLSGHGSLIEVTDVTGAVITENTSGDQHIRGVNGEVDADSLGGDLALDGITGKSLAASTHDGAIAATHVKSKKVMIRSTFGTILFSGELYAGGTVEIASYKGDVDVRLVPSKEMSFRLEAYARDGKLDPKLELAEETRPEAGRLVGSYGPARKKPAVLKVTSMVGDVRIGLVNE